jgi:hypothetical protein
VIATGLARSEPRSHEASLLSQNVPVGGSDVCCRGKSGHPDVCIDTGGFMGAFGLCPLRCNKTVTP